MPSYSLCPNQTQNFYVEDCPKPAKSIAPVTINWLIPIIQGGITASISVDSLVQSGQITGIQSALIDNSANDVPVYLVDAVGVAGEVPANSWGTIPVRYAQGFPIQILLAGSVGDYTNSNGGITTVTLSNVKCEYKIWQVQQTANGQINLNQGAESLAYYAEIDGQTADYFTGTINPVGTYAILTAGALNETTCPNGILISKILGGTASGFVAGGSLTDLWGTLFFMAVPTGSTPSSDVFPQYATAFEWKTGTNVFNIPPADCSIYVPQLYSGSGNGGFLCAGVNPAGKTPSGGSLELNVTVLCKAQIL